MPAKKCPPAVDQVSKTRLVLRPNSEGAAMRECTPAGYKPSSKSNQEMGRKMDRLGGSYETFAFGQPLRSQLSYSVRLNDWLRMPLKAELPNIVRALLLRGEQRIVLDLAGVPGIDAGGIGELVRAYNIANASNGALRIANTNPRVREMLERVGLFDRLNAGAK
jgi:anti-anti-sigma factor